MNHSGIYEPINSLSWPTQTSQQQNNTNIENIKFKIFCIPCVYKFGGIKKGHRFDEKITISDL